MGNRLALITGGTKGLGKAVAERLLADGYDVVLTYATDEERADAVRTDFLKKHPRAQVATLKADASDVASIDAIEQFFKDEQRGLDALILNAGLTDRSRFEELDLETWNRVFDANVHVPVFLIQRLLKCFSTGSSVVFTGSLMGIQPHSMSLAYGVTKASVHALVKNLVKFLAPHGIRVNGVAPGFIDTEWQLTKPAEIRASINSKVSLSRFATPEEVAEVYMTLIQNPYLTGETIVVDGGYSYR